MLTKYGILKGIEDAEYYRDGSLKACRLCKKNFLNTKLGVLIPQYESRDERRKLRGALEFYPNGNLMSIALDEGIRVKTYLGDIPAEKILFYENENIKRLFPLNGKLSGYWTEENEYQLAEDISIRHGYMKLSAKFISIAFYENESLKSLTLWPRERVELQKGNKFLKIRKGLSFYECGALRSYEPGQEIELETPIGNIRAYHNEVVGLNGDINSVEYYSNGSIKALYSCSNRIRAVEDGKEYIVEPELKKGWCNELVKVPVPLKIDFAEDRVVFNKNRAFYMDKSSFQIEKMIHKQLSEDMTC